MSGPVKALSMQQSDALIQFIRDDWTTSVQRRVSVRNETIALLMLDAGLRVGEVSQLIINDLLFADRPVQTLTVRHEVAKGHHRRDIPLSVRIRHSIVRLEQFVWCRGGHKGEEFAFPSVATGKHISSRQIQRRIASAGDIALGIPVHPHMLRHTFATLLMTKTSIRVVQQLLGHTSLQSTQIYTHPTSNDCRVAIDSLHPKTDEI